MGEPICEQMVRDAAKGKTFAEVGGLWGTSNEQVTTAGLGGARDLTMIDVAPPETGLWMLFEQRCAAMGVSSVAEINGSIDDRATVERAGSFDVVCCNGVLYHCPDPIRTLLNLRSISRETLILGTVTIPETVVTSAGTLETAAGSALPVPALTASQLTVVGQWLRELGDVHIQADGITNGVDWDLDDYSPWWWLFTRDHVAALLEITGFEVEAVAGYWEGRATYFRARAV
jgi:SAM-dependent methyltransferase